MPRYQQSAVKSSNLFSALTFLLFLAPDTIAAFPVDIHSRIGHFNNGLMETKLQMSSPSTEMNFTPAKNWSSLQNSAKETPTGLSLENDFEARKNGKGYPHVSNTLRLFESKDKSIENKPTLTFYRDNAGWCPYCEKTILLIEEKKIPINIQTVPMRSYGDKPREFMQMVPNGLLPALTVEDESGRKQVITESQVIMELLDEWHPKELGYRPMLPSDNEGYIRYQQLARLERDLFSWWCTFLFRPEGGPSAGAFGGILSALTNNGSGEMSASMKGFVDCLKKVDEQLRSTKGPWFFSTDDFDYPTMIDFIYISHIERMLASCAYWKGFKIRDSGDFPGIDAWLDAFDQRDSYLAFKSDFYTNVMDIPPQYGPGYYGGISEEVQEAYAKKIRGKDGSSWNLPLSHDDELEPLYKGPPLPMCVLEATGLEDYGNANEKDMATACRHTAAWKLASNGINVSRFAARGGAKGGKNPRKTFAAQLADPYADPDTEVRPMVDAILQIVCSALLENESSISNKSHEEVLNDNGYKQAICTLLSKENNEKLKPSIVASLAYLRDRVGVPRDMPLAAARQFRAHLNWSIDVVESQK